MATKINSQNDVALQSRPTQSLGEANHAFPASVNQQGFWYLDKLEPGNPAWNIAVRFRIRGPLDIPALGRALNEIVRRHEILRTTFAMLEGELKQVLHATG